MYKLLGSFIVQIYKVIKSQRERFLVCFRLNFGVRKLNLSLTGEAPVGVRIVCAAKIKREHQNLRGGEWSIANIITN
jgi:hypothetical protein